MQVPRRFFLLIYQSQIKQTHWLLLAVTLLGLLSGCVAAQPVETSPAAPTPALPSLPATPGALQPHRIVVVGDGSLRVQANIAYLNLSVNVVDETIEAANATADATMAHVIAALEAMAIAGEDIRPHSYNVSIERYYPERDPDDPGVPPLMPEAGEAIRYHVSHQLRVLVRDLEAMDEVVSTAVEAGGEYLYVNVTDFQYDDPSALEHDARAEAVADAQRKAEAIARQSGLELGQIVNISEITPSTYGEWSYFPGPLMPGMLQLQMRLQVEYAASGSGTATTTTPAIPVPAAPVTTTAPITTTAATSDRVTIVGGDEAALRDFLRLFFVQTFGPVENINTTVYIGTLPPDLPFTLELPAEVTVSGSVVTDSDYANTHLLFAPAGDVTELLVELRAQLEAQGYFRLPTAPQVFTSEDPSYSPLCSPDQTQMVTLSGRNLPDGTGVIRFYLSDVMAFSSPCNNTVEPSSSGFDTVMPTLNPPVAIGIYSSGSGSDPNGQETTIRFTADTTLDALAEHYHAQLVAQGWTLQDASATDDVAWSEWSFEDDGQAYTGTFYVMREPGREQSFQATVRVQVALP